MIAYKTDRAVVVVRGVLVMMERRSDHGDQENKY